MNSGEPAQRRCFLALWPEAPLAQALAQQGRALWQRGGGRLCEPEALHLTLACLGDLSAERGRALIAAARQCTGDALALHID